MTGVMVLSRHKTLDKAIKSAKKSQNTFIVQGKGILLVLAMVNNKYNLDRTSYGDFSSVNSSIPHLY